METNNQKLDEVKAKLRKLQNLYQGAKEINSEGEAAAAAAAIQRLLLEYNLTMESIGVEPEKNAMTSEDWSGYTYKSIGGWWEQKLVSVLCKYNMCKCFIYGSSYKRLAIVGTKENMEMVKWLRGFLSEKYVALSKESYAKYIKDRKERIANGNPKWEDFESPMSKDKYQRSFLVGCCHGLEDKLRKEREEDKRDAQIGAQVTALVLRTDTAINKWVEDNWGKTGTTKAGSREHFDSARAAGYTAGQNTDIHRPISGTRAAAQHIGALGM